MVSIVPLVPVICFDWGSGEIRRTGGQGLDREEAIIPPGHRESESESVGEEALIHIHPGKTAQSTRPVADKSVASNLCLIPQGRGVMQKYHGRQGLSSQAARKSAEWKPLGPDDGINSFAQISSLWVNSGLFLSGGGSAGGSWCWLLKQK